MDLLTSRSTKGAVVGRVGGGPVTRCSLAAAAFALMFTLGACAPSRPDTRPVAQCCVCRCNNDLGCLIVHIDEKTPRSEYQGRTVYFCSEECKVAFDKAPEKYPPRP